MTPAALRRVADRVVEASCLVAALSIPLYFTVLTNTGYEPDKAVLLRALAIVACAAWIVGWLCGPHGGGRGTGRNWLLVVGFAVFAAYALATLLSVEPTLSMWGSQQRQEGLWTRAAYLVFFVAAATRLRSVTQWNRLVTTLLFGSVPVVVYGLLQQFAIEPVPIYGDPSTLEFNVRSTLGQHLFLGSYLVMVIPFTAVRVLQNRDWRAAPRRDFGGEEILLPLTLVLVIALTFVGFSALSYHLPPLSALFPALLGGYVVLGLLLESLPDSRAMRGTRLCAYTLLLVAQILVLALTSARGAWLAGFASVPVFGFAVARRLRMHQVAWCVLAVTVALGLFVSLLNVPNGPLQPLRSQRALSRLANIAASAGGGGSGQGRLFIWEGVGALMTQHPAIGSTWGGVGRDLVGYGPETLHDSFQAVFPLELRRSTSEIWVWDRAHNIFLDDLVSAGILGLFATILAIALLFWRAIRLLQRVETPVAWLLIATASAVAAHLVDGMFSFETPFTLLILWLLIGLCAALPLSEPPPREQVKLSPLRVALPFWAGFATLCLLLALVPGVSGHPTLLAGLWVISAISGVAAVAWSLAPAAGEQTQTAPADGADRPGPDGAAGAKGMPFPSRRAIPILAPTVQLAAALALAGQMQYQTAAMAARNALTGPSSLSDQNALRYLQQASRTESRLAVYKTELGGELERLGAARGDSADPGYQPGAGDAETISPQHALALGRDQLFQLAADALQSARVVAPLDPDTYNNLGTLYLQWNRPQEALAMFRQAEQLSSQNPTYLDREALALLTAARLREAYAHARSALTLDNTYWYTYYTLALVDHRLGARERAKRDASLALLTVHNYWPPPPDSELSQMRTVLREG